MAQFSSMAQVCDEASFSEMGSSIQKDNPLLQSSEDEIVDSKLNGWQNRVRQASTVPKQPSIPLRREEARIIACERCAKAKTKCSRELPTCKRCLEKGLPCDARFSLSHRARRNFSPTSQKMRQRAINTSGGVSKVSRATNTRQKTRPNPITVPEINALCQQSQPLLSVQPPVLATLDTATDSSSGTMRETPASFSYSLPLLQECWDSRDQLGLSIISPGLPIYAGQAGEDQVENSFSSLPELSTSFSSTSSTSSFTSQDSSFLSFDTSFDSTLDSSLVSNFLDSSTEILSATTDASSFSNSFNSTCDQDSLIDPRILMNDGFFTANTDFPQASPTGMTTTPDRPSDHNSTNSTNSTTSPVVGVSGPAQQGPAPSSTQKCSGCLNRASSAPSPGSIESLVGRSLGADLSKMNCIYILYPGSSEQHNHHQGQTIPTSPCHHQHNHPQPPTTQTSKLPRHVRMAVPKTAIASESVQVMRDRSRIPAAVMRQRPRAILPLSVYPDPPAENVSDGYFGMEQALRLLTVPGPASNYRSVSGPMLPYYTATGNPLGSVPMGGFNRSASFNQ